MLDANQDQHDPFLSLEPVPPPPPPPSKKPLFLLLTLLFTLSAVAVFIYFPHPPKPTSTSTLSLPTPTPIPSLKATVTYLTGSAWLLVNDRKTELKENDVVSTNDILVTDSHSRIVLHFDDDSIVSVGDSSKIILSQLLPTNMVLTNQTGSIFARVRKDPHHAFTIQAKNYSVTAHGTTFAVENHSDITVSVLESSVEINDGTQTSTNVKSSQQWHDSNKTVSPLAKTPNDFIAWSQQTITSQAVPEPTPTPTPTETLIKLSGSASATDIILNWQTTNISSGGFKVIKSSEPNPIYPGNDYQFIDSSSVHQYVWHLVDGQTYHFRVCHYLDGKCQVYSNEVSVTAPNLSTPETSSQDSSQVSAIALSVIKDGNQAKLAWSLTGRSALGFKIVWSDQPDPVYPNRDSDHYHYLDSPDARTDDIFDLIGKKYYFRVCEYLGGKCGVYSNQVSLDY